MDNIIDLIATDSSPSDISDGIKSLLFAKSAEKLEQIKPHISNSLFGIDDEVETEMEEGEEV